MDLHTQAAERALLSPEEEAKSKRVRAAAKSVFAPTQSSKWILAGRLFPFLLPLIRRWAHKLPDQPLVCTQLARDVAARHPAVSHTDKPSCAVQRTLIESRSAIVETVVGLIAEHRAALKDSPASNPRLRTPEVHIQAGAHQGSVPAMRAGVQPGSFIDLLVTGNDRATGEGFTDSVLAQQVAVPGSCSLARRLHWRTPTTKRLEMC